MTSLFVKSYLNCLLPEKLDYIELAEESIKKLQGCVERVDLGRLREMRRVDELFDYLLDFWGGEGALFSRPEQFREVISLLISTQKGLTRGEMLSITKVDG